MKTRKYEDTIPLLALSGSESDSEENSPPVNTLAILRRLENQEQLINLNNRIKTRNQLEKAKYALPAAAAVLGTVSLGGFAYCLSKVITLPTSRQLNLMSEYNANFIGSSNKTCGDLFPLTAQCGNPLDTLDAKYCSGLFHVAQILQNNITSYTEPNISVFDKVCGIPNLLGYCNLMERDWIPLVNPEYLFEHLFKYIGVYAKYCYQASLDIREIYGPFVFQSLQDSAYEKVPKLYLNMSEFINKSCSSLFPEFIVGNKYNARTQKEYFYQCLLNANRHCQSISDFSENVLRYNQTIIQDGLTIFHDRLNDTLAQYTQVLNKYRNVMINETVSIVLKLQNEYQQIALKLNQTLPDYGVSCEEKFLTGGVLEACNYSAGNICVDEVDFFDWATAHRIWMLVGFFLLAFAFSGFFFVMCKGTTWLNQRNRIDELPDEEKKEVKEIFEVLGLHGDELFSEMKIETANDRIKNTIDAIPGQKKLINDKRFSFLMSVNRIIGESLSKVVIQKIFHDAELVLRNPVDQNEMSERRFAFLMGREDENSTIPINLSNEIAYKIFSYAGLPSRYPQAFVPNTTTITNRHFKESCFTFFYAREDELLVNHDITTPEIFQRIFSYAGLFNRHLAVGEYELISNEKLTRTEVERKQKQIRVLAGRYPKPSAGIVEWQLPIYHTTLKEKCFTFFSGRDDVSANVPQILPKEVFQRINAYTELFK